MPARKRTIQQLRTELQAKQRQLAALRAKRGKLAAQLEAADRQIAGLAGGGTQRRRKARRKPGPKPGRKPGRAKAAKAVKKARRTRKRATGKPLAECLRAVLKAAKKPMRIKDAMRAVTKAGYRSSSKDFYGIVATAIRDKAKFEKVGRGLYKAK